jgi:hypothetical protein
MTTMSSHARAWRFQGSGADRSKIVERRTVSVDQTTSQFFSDGSLGGLSPASGSPQLHINMPRGNAPVVNNCVRKGRPYPRSR